MRPIADASLAAWSGVPGFATLVVDGPLRGSDVDAVLSVVVAGLRAG